MYQTPVILKIDRILYAVLVSDYLSQSVLCILTRLPSKIDWLRILCKAELRCSGSGGITSIA